MFYLNLFGFVFFCIDWSIRHVNCSNSNRNKSDGFWACRRNRTILIETMYIFLFCFVLFWFDRVMVNWLSAIYLFDWFCYRFCKVKLQAAEVQSRIKISSHWFKVEFLFCVCGFFQYRYIILFFSLFSICLISVVYIACVFDWCCGLAVLKTIAIDDFFCSWFFCVRMWI